MMQSQNNLIKTKIVRYGLSKKASLQSKALLMLLQMGKAEMKPSMRSSI
jgi:hypothetical protein